MLSSVAPLALLTVIVSGPRLLNRIVVPTPTESALDSVMA